MRSLPGCIFLLMSLCALPLSAQERDGHTVVEKKGIALVKPQAWSKPSDAEVVKFDAFTDRSARGAAGAGYFVLRLPGGNDSQVQSSRIVKIIFQPVVPKNLVDDTQRQALQKNIDDLASVSDFFPIARGTLANYLKPLRDAASRYDSGEVMEDGVWTTLEKYRDGEIKKIELRLRRSLIEAKVKRAFDLKSNADFIKLGELAESDAGVRDRLAAIEAEQAHFVSREEQEEIISKLQSPMSPGDSTPLIEKLKNLPDPGPRTSGVLKQVLLASEITKEIEGAKQACEALWSADFLASGKLPAMPPDLAARVDTLASRLEVYRAGSPPAGLWVPMPLFQACTALKGGWSGLSARLEERKYKLVIDEVDALLPKVRQVGEKTVTALESIKSQARSEILKFTKLVEEGNALLALNDKKQATAKFQAALQIMPDADIEKRVSEIK